MTYPFECSNCGLTEDVVATHGLKYDIPRCVDCGKPMRRVWTPPQISAERPVGYVPAFDKDVRNRRELVDAKKAYADRHGVEPIEIGNEKKALNAMKPKLEKYGLTRVQVEAIKAKYPEKN